MVKLESDRGGHLCLWIRMKTNGCPRISKSNPCIKFGDDPSRLSRVMTNTRNSSDFQDGGRGGHVCLLICQI